MSRSLCAAVRRTVVSAPLCRANSGPSNRLKIQLGLASFTRGYPFSSTPRHLSQTAKPEDAHSESFSKLWITVSRQLRINLSAPVLIVRVEQGGVLATACVMMLLNPTLGTEGHTVDEKHNTPSTMISFEEVKKHNTKDDCWVVIKDQVRSTCHTNMLITTSCSPHVASRYRFRRKGIRVSRRGALVMLLQLISAPSPV